VFNSQRSRQTRVVTTNLLKKDELETKIRASLGTIVRLPKLETDIQLVHKKLVKLDYVIKRLALDMLKIKFGLGGYDSVEIDRAIPIEDMDFVSTSS